MDQLHDGIFHGAKGDYCRGSGVYSLCGLIGGGFIDYGTCTIKNRNQKL